jgi:biotin operon repressor
MDQPKMQRLLRLLLLLSGKRTYSAPELAKRLSLSERTVLRYLETFDGAGFVVERSGSRYRMHPGTGANRAVQQGPSFSEEELYLLHSAISGLMPANKAALHLQKKLHTLYHYRALAETAEKSDGAKIAAISEAAEKKRCVHLNGYRSGNSQTGNRPAGRGLCFLRRLPGCVVPGAANRGQQTFSHWPDRGSNDHRRALAARSGTPDTVYRCLPHGSRKPGGHSRSPS